MKSDQQKTNNNILLGRVKKINPVNQRKGDVVKIPSLLDCIYDEKDVKKVSTQTYESNGATTSKSKIGKKIILNFFRYSKWSQIRPNIRNRLPARILL